MVNDGARIEATLEQLAERVGDPAPQVYARLFELAPGLAPMFAMDTDGSVRAEMLHRAFETLLDLTGEAGGDTARAMIETEYVNHCGMGVPPEQFFLFFEAISEVTRCALGEAFTADDDAAWRGLLGRLRGLVGQA
ncbi:MAG: globin [Burkholderiaceae bacterium]